jgi:hypothetical protein
MQMHVWFGPHCSGSSQVPHETIAQPVFSVPHFQASSAHEVSGVQPPQTLSSPPPPQLCRPAQVPQLRVLPHPSEIEPQFLPSARQVVGVQPHTPGVPLPPQL